MNRLSRGPVPSTYIWEEQTSELQRTLSQKGKQAAYVSLVQRRNRNEGAPIEPELYVCKWYATANLGPQAINGKEYIRREWQTLSSVSHPNIVRYADFAYDDTGPKLAKLVMEYCSEGDLSQFVNGKDGQLERRMSVYEGAQVILQIAQALVFLHHGIFRSENELKLAKLTDESGGANTEWKTILHRDIKPENVFVAQRDENSIKVKLGDFGIAKFQSEGTDTYVGTRDYFAPEQRTANPGGARTTFKSDIYSLGVSMLKVVQFSNNNTNYPKNERNKTLIGPRLEVLLTQCIVDDDGLRPNSAEIIDDLSPFLDSDSPRRPMLHEAVHAVIKYETQQRETRNDSSISQLGEIVELCHRLLKAGSDPNIRSEGEKSLLDQLRDHTNARLEDLGSPQHIDHREPSISRDDPLRSLDSRLKAYNAKGEVKGYDIGHWTDEDLRNAPSEDRRNDMLLDALKPKMVFREPEVRDEVYRILKSLDFNQLLRFTIDDNALYARVAEAEKAIKPTAMIDAELAVLSLLEHGEAPSRPERTRDALTDSRSRLDVAAVEKSVRHLLVATKQLLETLTGWSKGTVNDEEVSDVYVRMGYEFNITCRAFAAIAVDTSDFGPVPDLLRIVLEEMLSEEPSQAILDEHLPKIRDIIINLLHSLKRKQRMVQQITTSARRIGQTWTTAASPSSSSRSLAASNSQEEFTLRRPTTDKAIENLFRKLMQKRGWDALPEQAKRQMEAYSVDKKWTAIYQDTLSEWHKDQKKKDSDPQTSSGASIHRADWNPKGKVVHHNWRPENASRD